VVSDRVPPLSPDAGSHERAILARMTRSLGGLRTHAPSLTVFAICSLLSLAVFLALSARGLDRQRAAFNADAAPLVANLRSAFEAPLEVLASTAALFEASEDVTRAEFSRFARPALERHPGIRALEWIPVVSGAERARYEGSARADGLLGFQFRERSADGSMVSAQARPEYLPIFFMEPGHPLVLGFDCNSESERRACADRARSGAGAVASQRLQMIDDPPSTYSIAVFHPVFAIGQPRSREAVLGLSCEVFRVRAVAEQAIEESLRRDIQVALLDLDAPAERRVLFESTPGLVREGELGMETALRYADRHWQIVLRAGPLYRGALGGRPWFALVAGLSSSALLALGLSASKVIARLRRQIRVEQQLGQYTLLEKLGEGGAGVVYKARHAMLRRPTAIKLQLQPSADPRRFARFEREVQLTSELSHPNTIAIYDYGRTREGILYYAMEFIEGITLEQLVRREGALPAARVAHLLGQVCHAMTEAHAVGLVHRDLKPSNVMICRRGGVADFVKVMDYGLVKDIGADDLRPHPETLTQSSTTVLGTPLYLAPEAISRPGEVDARADIYALGAIAYFLLAGQPVFDGGSVLEVLSRHLHAAPERPSERSAHAISAAFEDVVMRCLEKEPERRFASMTALLAALRALSDIGTWNEADAQAWWSARGDALVVAVRQAAALEPARALEPEARAAAR
jgi:CHASE1-domain containing sensor protein/tRNA A-37 threonylcarbamoyl transferase component Bud32